VWIARRRHAGSPHLPRPRTVIVEALLAMAAVPCVLMLVSFFLWGLGQLLGESTMPTRSPFVPIARSPNRYDWIGLIILAVAVAPIAEEVFFRGMLYNALRRRLPVIVAALIQAILFGLVHPFGVVDRLAIVLIGLVLAAVYEWRKTLVAPMLLHALINTVGMVGLFVGISADANTPKLGVFGDRQQDGCRITQVVPGGAAEAAGLQVGDVVTALDDQPVADILEMARIIGGKRSGETVSIVFVREGVARQVEAVLKAMQR
jgi:membrane protease YdiL (CAAX protease family)